MPYPVSFLCDRYVICLKSEHEDAHASVTHRISIKLQLTGKSRLISQLKGICGKLKEVNTAVSKKRLQNSAARLVTTSF